MNQWGMNVLGYNEAAFTSGGKEMRVVIIHRNGELTPCGICS